MPTSTAPFMRSTLAGAIPLVAGSAVYELWRATGRDELMLVGVAVIALGVVSTTWGALAFRRERAAITRWDRRSRIRGTLAIALLVACYPVAIALTMRAAEYATTYGVEVWNDSRRTVVSCRLVSVGIDAELGPIPPGETVTHRLAFQADGELRCLAETSDGTRHRMLIEGYVTASQSGEARLVFDREGSPQLSRR